MCRRDQGEKKKGFSFKNLIECILIVEEFFFSASWLLESSSDYFRFAHTLFWTSELRTLRFRYRSPVLPTPPIPFCLRQQCLRRVLGPGGIEHFGPFFWAFSILSSHFLNLQTKGLKDCQQTRDTTTETWIASGNPTWHASKYKVGT